MTKNEKQGTQIYLDKKRAGRFHWNLSEGRDGGTNFPRKVAHKFLKSFQVMDQIFYHRCLSVFEGQFFKGTKKRKTGEKTTRAPPLFGVAQNKNPSLQLVDSRSYIKNILPQLIIDSLFILIRTNIVIISYDDKLI